MSRSSRASFAMLVLGSAMLAASALASPSLRKGGIFRVGTSGASVQIDPQLGYVTTAWWLEYATAAKLYNYPDRGGGRLAPEVATRAIVSNGGEKDTLPHRQGIPVRHRTPLTA